jgi:glycine cleavage system T protein (aminomethyltransferase)
MGARLIPFGGWSMPVEYSGIAKEHTAVRTAAGLFDVSHMGEFQVTGDHALDLVQHVTSNDASSLADGQAQYSALTTPEGTAVDDLLVYRHAEDHFMLVVNAANIDIDLEWIQSHNTFGARVENASDRISLLALQGPRAAQILQPLADIALTGVLPYHFVSGKVLGVDTLLSRTGYTGEDGFELYFAVAESEKLWNGILKSGEPWGLLAAGLGARNTLRLEAKFLLYGNDLARTTTLLEAGLGWIVKFKKPGFIGRESLARQKAEGVQRKLAGFIMLGRDIARDHYPVYVNGVEVSHVTSGSPSITLKQNIGLTYLPLAHTAPGTKLQVSVRGRACEAEVVQTPFYKRKDS